MKKLKKDARKSKGKPTGSQSIKNVKDYPTLFDGLPNCDEWLTVKGSYDLDYSLQQEQPQHLQHEHFIASSSSFIFSFPCGWELPV